MAKSSLNNAAPMVILVSIAMLIATGLGQVTPIPPFTQILGLLSPLPDVIKCWSSLTSIPSCLTEVYGSFLLGQIGKIDPVCCEAINEINDNCWPKMFPLNPFFPPLIKNFCAAPPLQAIGTRRFSSQKPLIIPHVGVNVTEITECWKPITNTEGCTLEVYKSLTTGHIVGSIGSACCKIITEINNKCWPNKMFPYNPFFPPLLKGTCAKVITAAPAPKAI
ncbi:ECA1 gametogenesis related family protein [Melia azedarach]|uniref:ECA1 gametogenesis related family protein n=1 Tax=Melia azedarach TaxID=155640 RepID=A0ACC1XDX1_MELAZ|nr:ECA1 gametogenesis related family protein [Melia azedarach]